ncbi:hypothetical protein ACTI_85500 [Actinoplanes sp. OR16]|uniref:hypothetical protein n=1 Tax=Actinoplanes sp. OR16 TaxID=946334 RepID=UPI000F6D108F|nr:hypothetical protein [Actinoplanes sp. OR16]BBH71865.1 hypothetical protein ACTI_85500 [Actinoplanes sp. OR16]
MKRAGYQVTIGGWTVDSAADPRTELTAVETSAALGSAGDLCDLRLHAPPAAGGSPLGQAAGAALGLLTGEPSIPTAAVRGHRITPGDTMTVVLTAGDRSATVMTAEVQAVESGPERVRVTGATATQILAGTRVNQVYENQTAGQIVADLARQAGVTTGTVDQGGRIPYFVAHESRSVLRCLRELARRDGLDLYCDVQNRLTMTKFAKTGPDHVLRYGVDLLALQLTGRRPVADAVRVVGESAASSRGTGAWHRLARDNPPTGGGSGSGGRTLAAQDGAVRSKAAADAYATAWLGELNDQASAGRLRVLGHPGIVLGDAVEIAGAPRPELNGLFKVTAVRHVLNKRDGFVTRVAFTGQGGASAAAGLLGGAADAIGGLLGS